ncbi:hypothetical protein [Pseudonocardia kunmingensis]|uniref:hypothetical protein n=1 Tax=Pseudonocardia kunmingensis TaxID=630975 RepID=UPI0011528D0F|nr:hypothetical protein [Pseudonocardia kunmingensis]
MRSLILARLGDGLGLVTPEQYAQLGSEFYGADAEAVPAEYPQSRYESPIDEAVSAHSPVCAYEFAEPTGDVIEGSRTVRSTASTFRTSSTVAARSRHRRRTTRSGWPSI